MYAIYQSVNKLISQSVNQCLGLSVNQWASKLFRRSASQSVFSSSVSPSASQSVSQSVSLPVSWSVNVQSISQSVSSSVNKSVGQPWSQSVFSPPVSHPISMSTSQSIGLKSFNSLLIGWSFSSPLHMINFCSLWKKKPDTFSHLDSTDQVVVNFQHGKIGWLTEQEWIVSYKFREDFPQFCFQISMKFWWHIKSVL